MVKNLGDELKNKIISSSNFGLIGSILVILGLIPQVGSILAIIGLILILIALYELSNAYNNSLIFDNALKAIIAGIIGFAIFAFVSVISIFTMVSHGIILGAGLAIAAVIIAYLVILAYGYFIRNSYYELAKSSGIKRFEEVGKFYWWGGILLIVLVGAIFILIADIYAILAFHELNLNPIPQTINK
jgi:Predicted membrane protein